MLINCSLYKHGQKRRDLEIADISEAILEPESFVWVALSDPTEKEISIMKEEFNLHPLAVEDALHGSQRPKIEEYGDTLFATMRIPVVKDDEIDWGEVCLFVGEKYVLSMRQHLEKGFADVRSRCERESHLLNIGAGFVFYAIIDNVVDRYFPIIDNLENRMEQIENQIFKLESARHQIEAIYDLKQKVMDVKHAIIPLLDAIDKLHGGRVPKICSGIQDYFRDVYDHLYRLDQANDHTREMLITATQVNLALISLNETQVSKRLASWAALLAVPTMIAGIYGMNFKYMPELESPMGYPITLAVMLVIDLYLLYRFKKAGWI
jgi:magnesium transporter